MTSPDGGDERSAYTEQLRSVTSHRAELRESVNAVEAALAAPVPGRELAWLERARAALMELFADFREHVQLSEGSRDVDGSMAIGGSYAALLRVAPRLSSKVDRLCQEHVQLLDAITGVLEQVEHVQAELPAAEETGLDPADALDRLRDSGTDLLSRLVRHRQRGSDLFYEAYAVDIGGQD